MLRRLRELAPEVNAEHLRALADLWSRERDLILDQMLRIAQQASPGPIPMEARHQAILELAMLRLWLEDRIVAAKTRSERLEAIDPSAEALSVESEHGRERIENTAKACAEGVWLPLLAKWRSRFPRIIIDEAKPSRVQRRSMGPGVRHNHFSPVFSNKRWASGAEHKVRVYDRGLDLRIRTKDVGYRFWGREDYLYSQQLESYFQLVESDAKRPHDRLVALQPIDEGDRRHWVAFLLVQLLRTPAFLVSNLRSLRAQIESEDMRYPTNVSDLRRAFETLFQNDAIFASFYRRLCAREWSVWTAPRPHWFVRSDNPVILRRSPRGWELLYPLGPDECFVVGPDKIDRPPDFAAHRAVGDEVVSEVNRLSASRSTRSVLGLISPDDKGLRGLLSKALPMTPPPDEWFAPSSDEFWGPMA